MKDEMRDLYRKDVRFAAIVDSIAYLKGITRRECLNHHIEEVCIESNKSKNLAIKDLEEALKMAYQEKFTIQEEDLG